jgi:hypothetical protein
MIRRRKGEFMIVNSEQPVTDKFWYPIQEIGPVKNANRRVAVNLEPVGDGYRIGVAATEALDDVTVSLSIRGDTVFERRVHVRPGEPFVAIAQVPHVRHAADLLLRVLDCDARELIRFAPIERQETELPAPAAEPLCEWVNWSASVCRTGRRKRAACLSGAKEHANDLRSCRTSAPSRQSKPTYGIGRKRTSATTLCW